jgi:hypothetical protein
MHSKQVHIIKLTELPFREEMKISDEQLNRKKEDEKLEL